MKKETKVQRLERLLKSARRKIKKLEEENGSFMRQWRSDRWAEETGRK